MSNTIVIYKTKYGSAKKYAQWLAEELKADIAECSDDAFSDIDKYDTVIYGGSLYMVGILGFDVYKKHFHRFNEKQLVVFTVGASPAKPEDLKDVTDNNFTDEIKEKVNYYHLRGGFNFKRLNAIDKVLMTLLKLKFKLKRNKNLTDEEKGMLASYDKPYDWMNKKHIAKIVEQIKKE